MFQIHLVRAALERGNCWLPLFIATLNTYDERSIIIISRRPPVYRDKEEEFI